MGEVRDAGRIGVVEGGKGSRHLSYPVISKALQDRGTLTLNLTEPFLVTTMSQLLYPKPKPKPNPNPNPKPIQGIWARGTWHIDPSKPDHIRRFPPASLINPTLPTVYGQGQLGSGLY